jgi:hypothetical protein
MISDEVFRKELDGYYKRQGMKKLVRNGWVELNLIIKDDKMREEILETERKKAIAKENEKAEIEYIPIEAQEQKRFVEWFHMEHPDNIIFMIRNDGYRTQFEKSEQKAMGLHSGASDLCIPVGWGCIWVEMKRTKNAAPYTDEQREFCRYVESLPGKHKYILAYGCEDAIKQVGELL